jgi:hypothetical protein
MFVSVTVISCLQTYVLFCSKLDAVPVWYVLFGMCVYYKLFIAVCFNFNVSSLKILKMPRHVAAK